MEYTFYKLSIADKCYIGSTNDFNGRVKEHKSNCNNENGKKYNFKVYQYIRENGCWNDVDITIIETKQCNKDEALDFETKFMLSLNAELNSRYPKRSAKEWREANKEYQKQYDKEYRKNNKEKISERGKEKIACDICGKMGIKRNLSRHKKIIHSFTGGNIHQV